MGLQQSASMALSRMGADSTAAQPCEVSTEQYLIGLAVAAVAEAQEADSSDIWQDQQTLQYLREQTFSPEWSPAARGRIRKRAH